MPPLIVALPGSEQLADQLAERMEADRGGVFVKSFPDEESYIRLENDVAGRDVLLVCTLDRPNRKILPLCFTAAAAKELGGRSVGLVAPYLAYMRQDIRFKPGEAVSSSNFARIIEPWFDRLVTIDPHLHRNATLSAVYTIPNTVLHAADYLADWIATNIPDPILVGPDEESRQWVSAVAQRASAPFVVLEKIRRGDRDVEVSVPDVEQWKHRTPVLIDDIISTARTMIETVGHIRHAGLSAPVAIGVHAVFAGDAHDALQKSGCSRIVTTNTISHPTNAIDITPLLAKGLGSQPASER
jgi:ribose-phosphate pyrophosphokinase